MAENVAVRISGVKKMYRLGQIGGGTLQRDIQSWWARIRHKEDPNSKIGEKRLVGQTFMALNGINLTIRQGEAIGIIGSNGAGKSTLLKLLSRVTAPTEGEIDIYGRITSMLEVGTGFNGEMTGRENIYMNGAILGMTKEEIDAKMEEIIEFSEVRDFIDTPVKRYSSGMYVKLAFSVAAHLDSEIMIMDEVLAVGDMAFQKKCLDKMRQAAKQQGRTVLYVSHNMNTIRQLCDRCVVLDQGKVVYDGDNSNAIALYLGNRSELKSQYIYTEKDHEKWCHYKMDIVSFTSVTDMSLINYGGDLSFELCYKVLEDVNEIRFRLVIVSDNDQIIGMSMTKHYFEGRKGAIGRLKFLFNTSPLAPGCYKVRFSAFNLDQFGNHEYVCCVSHLFGFKIQQIDNNSLDVTWQNRSWGFVTLNDIVMENN